MQRTGLLDGSDITPTPLIKVCLDLRLCGILKFVAVCKDGPFQLLEQGMRIIVPRNPFSGAHFEAFQLSGESVVRAGSVYAAIDYKAAFAMANSCHDCIKL